jgi:hypothetical protein
MIIKRNLLSLSSVMTLNMVVASSSKVLIHISVPYDKQDEHSLKL